MNSLCECIKKTFRDCFLRSDNDPVVEPIVVEVQENPTVEEPKNNLEEEISEDESEDLYIDLPPLVPIDNEEYGTDEELEELNSNQSDGEYRY
jgi:hypothetical protein